ncbi:hypothetical protein HDV57DRAFT_345948 [Trichoderma longibrachiatum]
MVKTLFRILLFQIAALSFQGRGSRCQCAYESIYYYRGMATHYCATQPTFYKHELYAGQPIRSALSDTLLNSEPKPRTREMG